MFFRGLSILTAGLLALSWVGAQAQIRKIGSRYSFHAKYANGTTLSFDFTTRVEPFGPGASASQVQTIQLPVRMSVLDVIVPKKKGDSRLAKIRSEAGPIQLNKKPFKPKSVVTVTVDDLNRLQGKPGEEIPQFTTPLPEKPLRIGESWSSVIDPSGSIPFSMTVTASYRLLKVVRNLAYVRISMSGKGTGKSQISTRGTGTMVLRTSDGTLNGLDMVQTVFATNSAGAKTTIAVRRKV